MQKARIAVIGTGWWATYAHLPALADRADVEVVALANRGRDKLQLAAGVFQVANTYTDYRQMLARERLDGVIVAAQHDVHYEAAKAALLRGCHVLVEKPMVLKGEEARELLDLARRGGRQMVVSYPNHYTAHARQRYPRCPLALPRSCAAQRLDPLRSEALLSPLWPSLGSKRCVPRGPGRSSAALTSTPLTRLGLHT